MSPVANLRVVHIHLSQWSVNTRRKIAAARDKAMDKKRDVGEKKFYFLKKMGRPGDRKQELLVPPFFLAQYFDALWSSGSAEVGLSKKTS